MLNMDTHTHTEETLGKILTNCQPPPLETGTLRPREKPSHTAPRLTAEPTHHAESGQGAGREQSRHRATATYGGRHCSLERKPVSHPVHEAVDMAPTLGSGYGVLSAPSPESSGAAIRKKVLK